MTEYEYEKHLPTLINFIDRRQEIHAEDGFYKTFKKNQMKRIKRELFNICYDLQPDLDYLKSIFKNISDTMLLKWGAVENEEDKEAWDFIDEVLFEKRPLNFRDNIIDRKRIPLDLKEQIHNWVHRPHYVLNYENKIGVFDDNGYHIIDILNK